MSLYKCGITVEVSHPSDIARYKKLGYVEVKTEVEEPAVVPERPSIEQIYALCDKAGVNPEDLRIEGEHPTLAEVKAAIKAAKKVVKDGA